MLLAIDCGNTNTKFGFYEGAAPGGRFVHTFRLDTDAKLTAEAYRARFDREAAAAGLAARDVTGVGLATVVPGARVALFDFARGLTGTDPVVIGAAGVDPGLRILIERPGDVGADRLADAAAVHAGWPGTVIVLDFGTATTFNLVTAAGDYAGGVIAPGINLALDALHAGTAQLPRIAVAKPGRVIGTDTVSAMESGIYWGYVGLIEGIVARMMAEYPDGGGVTVVATGGLAPLFAKGTSVIDVIDQELTLRGIVLIYQRNRTI